MLYFENKRTKDTVCMECVTFDEVRIQTVFDPGFYLRHEPVDSNLHLHLNHELYFVEAGECTVSFKGGETVCSEGAVLLITAGTEHCVTKMSEGARLVSMRSSFYPEKEGSALYAELATLLRAPVYLKEARELLALIKPIQRELVLQKRFFEEKLQGLLKIFYAELFRLLFSVPPVEKEEFPSANKGIFRGLKNFREETPDEFYMEVLDEFFTHLPPSSCTLSELSLRLCLSVSQAQRLIKRYYGVSFREKLIEAKIRKSILMIEKTDMPLEEIAREVGYDSYNAFFEAFSSVTGKKPSEYKKQKESNL